MNVEHIEARILRLAEAATSGPWHLDDRDPLIVWTSHEKAFGGEIARAKCGLRAADDYPRSENHPAENMALIAALSPATVSRLARVVEQTRTYLAEYHWIEGHVADVNCEWLPCAAVAALDADAPEGGAEK